MPRVTVEWLAGRTDEQREEVARLFTEAMTKVIGLRPEQITVMFRENTPNQMAKAGVLISRDASLVK